MIKKAWKKKRYLRYLGFDAICKCFVYFIFNILSSSCISFVYFSLVLYKNWVSILGLKSQKVWNESIVWNSFD